jgi:hypothetical protein
MIMMNPSPADLGRKHRAEPVPPETYRLVADIDAPIKQQILDLAQRKRISNIHHHCQADDFGGAIEITERIIHPEEATDHPPPHQPRLL